jgi:glycine/D-amino acid oxidase-like deaminating enzyme/nitrite reductase/ring-hydroxylating ferredoxin subunit
MENSASLWSDTVASPATFARLEKDIEVDVAIVGGGMTGLTAAMLLAEAGKRVVLVEARTLGSGVTSRSTVHLTEIVDTRYASIESDFGKEGARLVADSSRAAIELVSTLASPECGFQRRVGWLFTEDESKVDALRDEVEAARRAGLDARLASDAPLPFATRAGMIVPDQAQMHIMRYVAHLAKMAQEKGASIHEHSRVLAIDDGEPCMVHLENGAVIRARAVFTATHAPLNRVFLQTKIAAYRSYVMAYPNVTLPDGLFWDMEDPYHYFSSYLVDGSPYLIVGGEDHKTGSTTKTGEHYEKLHAWTKERFAVGEAAYRWSAQVEEPVDGLPFIGKNALADNVFVATGFSGNGTTFGTISAMIVRDILLGRANPWAELYSATRVKPVASLGTYVRENVDFPLHLLSDRIAPPDAKSLDEIAPGEGKTIRIRGERLAVHRAEDGRLSALSSVCTHLGCIVKWNGAERTWDCPCHGSRFAVDGEVLDGPAAQALARRELHEEHRASGVVPTADVGTRKPRKKESGT